MSDYLVELHDTMFSHGASAGGPLPWPDLPFRWDRSGNRRQLAVYSDTSLLEAKTRQDGVTIAWLLESPRATRQEYRWVARNALLFDRVLTFEQSLLEELPNAMFTPLGGCWLLPKEWKLHAKSKNLSIIASHKRKMPGQELRHEVIRRYGERFDAVLGGGYRWIENKIEGLREYRYSMAIENCRQNYYFSEKLIDCLMSGTVPIYWGCPSIGLFFDTRGIVTFEHPRELDALLERIGPEDYERRLPAIRRNQELARRFIYPEAHVWENIRDLALPVTNPAQQ
jgi:hypothetical protein